MQFVDYIVLIVAVFLISIVLLQESKDDISDAFSGESSDLFKNQKQRGFDLVLLRATMVLSIIFVALVIVSNSL